MTKYARLSEGRSIQVRQFDNDFTAWDQWFSDAHVARFAFQPRTSGEGRTIAVDTASLDVTSARPGNVIADPVAFSLALGNFSQNWTTDNIAANNDWSAVPSIIGFASGDLPGSTAIDVQNFTADLTIQNVINNASTSLNTGGILDVRSGTSLAGNPTIAFQGSNAQDVMGITVFLDATGRENIVVQALLREIEDAVADASIQQVAVQYRTSPSGTWTTVQFIADASAAATTAINVMLPAAANNQSQLQVRFITGNAAGADEMIGVDDILISSTAISAGPGVLAIGDVTHLEGDAGAITYSFTVTRTGGSTGAVSATWTLNAPGGANNADSADFIIGQAASGTVSFADGEISKTIEISVQGDDLVEDDENFTVTLSAPVGTTISDDSGAGVITNDDAAGTFSIDDVIVTEGNSGTTAMTFTVTRASGDDGAVSVDYTVVAPGGAGLADSGDFAGGTTFLGTLSFADGETSKTITLDVIGDHVVETDEGFTILLSNATGGSAISDGSGAGTITNDDFSGSLSIGDVTLAEGNSGTTSFSFTVLRSSGSAGAVGASWTLDAPGGANLADLADFAPGQPTSGTVSFADGETSQTITVLVQGDVSFEDTETFLVTLSTPTGGATLGNANGTGTITNDDAAPAGTLSIDDVSHSEGDSGPTSFTFTVSRAGGTAGAITADYVISAPGGAGNADSGDFVGGSIFSGQVAFADGEISKTITIDAAGDIVFEADEAFTVTLSNATGGASIGDGTGTGTIVNDDAAPPAGSVSIADISIVEGNAGTSLLVLTVTRTGGTGAFSVDFATSNGGNPNNASATAGSDYVAQSGTLNFADGQLTATISITINGDTTAELSEEFSVTLSNATNGATLSDAIAIATITADDTASNAPVNAWINEFHYDNAGGDTGEFIEIAGAAGIDLSEYSIVRYNGTVPGAAVVYTSPAQTTTLTGTMPNQGGTGFGTFAVNFPADGLQNGTNDGFALVRTVAGTPTVLEFWSYEGVATAANGPAMGMISIDVGVVEPGDATGTSIARTSGPPGATWVLAGTASPGAINPGQTLPAGGVATPSIAVSDVSVNEAAGTMTFTITRTNVAPGAFSVDYATADGTATAGSDYTATSGTLSFTDNQVQAQVTVLIGDDGAPELDETVLLNLTNATAGATISDAQGVGTILNDDGTPILVSINDVSIAEGDAGTSILTFTVTRTGATGAFDVNFTTANDSATAGSDYVAQSGTLNFAAGQNSQTISITINGDTDPESTETFFVNLSGATNGAVIADAIGVGTIVNDEGTFIHDIQGTSYFSPILANEGIASLNVASTAFVTVRAVVTAVDNQGNRQGFYISEEVTDWDGNSYTSEGIYVMTRNDASVGTAVSGVAVGDLVTVTARVMEYQGFATNMPITALVNASSIVVNSTGNTLPTFLLDAGHPIPNSIMTGVTPNYFDSADGVGDTFDASLYAMSFFETVEGMLVTIPDMVVADGFVSSSGGRPFLQAYSTVHADADQINSRGGYTIAGDPPIGPPDTADTEDGTIAGGRHLSDGDVNPDIIELDFTGWAMAPPTGLSQNATMGDLLGDVTGIIDFEFTDRKLFVTSMEPGGFVDGGNPVQDTTLLGDDSRALTVATFNVENLDPTDGAARFTALANAIANNLNAPDIICIEEMQDNNGAAAGDGIDDDPITPGMQDATGTDASQTWQMLVDALNLATGSHYQWIDQAPVYNAEGGEQSGNIRVGFLYNTDRVQLGNLDANATLAERRMYTDRIGDGVRDGGDLIAYSDNMIAGEINTADWTTTRKSLLGEFTFHGNTVYVTANHWPSKGGSGEFWQYNQNIETGQPSNSDWSQRSQVGQDVYRMFDLIQSGNPNAGIVAGGDFNDFYFYRPLTTVTGYTMADGTARVGGARFDNLTLTLTEAERYTYTFDGRSQAIDHIIANQLLSGVATYDVVHLNSGYNENGTGPNASPALSDHDPGVSSYDYRNFSEVLGGTAGNDVIFGFGGNDTISGFDGADYLDGGVGADTMTGGAGDDTYVVDEVGDQVIEGPGAGNDRIITSISYTLAGNVFVETLEAVAGVSAINLTGNYLVQTLIGNDGANQLHGGGAADTLIGLGGDDIYYTDVAAIQVVEGAGGGNDQLYTSVSFVLALGSEVELLSTNNTAGTGAINLTGNASNQTVVGNNGANQLHGGGGVDTLIGYGGNDIYYTDVAATQVVDGVGEGFDQLYTSVSYVLGSGEIELLSTNSAVATAAIDLTGNQFGQLVLGNAGANVLDGKGGADTLVGYGGADTFAFTSALGAGNVDVVADFVSGTDKIALDDAVFTALGLGALSANAFVIGSDALDADDRIIYNTSNGGLYYDADGAGGQAAILFAYLSSVPAITASDFTVI
jgi:predicted extracellular nuclease